MQNIVQKCKTWCNNLMTMQSYVYNPVMQYSAYIAYNATVQRAKYDLHCYHWVSLIGETVSDHKQVDAKISPR